MSRSQIQGARPAAHRRQRRNRVDHGLPFEPFALLTSNFIPCALPVLPSNLGIFLREERWFIPEE
jgi:hypothetical protein